MRIGLLTLVIAAVLGRTQAKEEIELTWGLPKDSAIDYAVSEIKGGRPVPLKDRTFLLFPSDLTGDGSNTLVVNTYHDLPWRYVLRLPKGKVKTGARWIIDEELFEEARQALTTLHCFRAVAVKGALTFKKIEKVNDVDCARVDGVFQLFEIKFDEMSGKKSVSKTEWGHFATAAWFSLKDTILIKGSYDYAGKGEEFKGIKGGEEPKQIKVNGAEMIEAKKELVKIDQLTHFDRISAAIRNGVVALRKMQRSDGSWVDEGGSFARDFPFGTTALSLMAMLHSGVKADDPAVKSGFAYAMKGGMRKTYDVAATIMAIETKYLPLEKLGDLEGLTEKAAREQIVKSISKEDLAYVQRGVDWLVEKQTKDGTWGYPEEGDFKDHSNTQYAMLALKSASRCGVKVKAEVWKKALNHWLTFQGTTLPSTELKLTWTKAEDMAIDEYKPDEKFVPGPWGYFIARKPEMKILTDRGYGSMTCAGLTSILVAESELLGSRDLDAGLKKRCDTAKKQGLAWIQTFFTVRGCPPAAGLWSIFQMYYLYSLERVGVLYGITKFGEHDWYQEGAMVLVHSQHEDGSWNTAVDIPPVETAFALLFLKKATVRVATKSP